jgi:predicted dienelactone hydrolase
MFNFTRAALQLEKAAKCASDVRDDVLTANHLAKAEKLIMGVSFNMSETRALISMYDRVLTAAASLGGTIPIKEHCEQIKQLLYESML